MVARLIIVTEPPNIVTESVHPAPTLYIGELLTMVELHELSLVETACRYLFKAFSE